MGDECRRKVCTEEDFVFWGGELGKIILANVFVSQYPVEPAAKNTCLAVPDFKHPEGSHGKGKAPGPIPNGPIFGLVPCSRAPLATTLG